MNPRTAKLRFKLRSLNNCLAVGGIFLAVAFIAAQFPNPWIAQAVAMGLLFYLFFYIWENRAIGLHCPHCKKFVATNTPWVCGFCNRENRRIDQNPFVSSCQHCGAETKTYKCHHRRCGNLIFLTGDELEDNFAYCVNTRGDGRSEDDGASREKQKKAVEHEIAMSELTGRLNAAKQRSDLEKKRSPFEKKKESFSQHHASTMAVHEIAREEKAANARKYKDDPEMLKLADEAVDDWVRSET